MPGNQRPAGAVIEIVERRKTPIADDEFGDLIFPDAVRINGQPLLIPADRPVKVHSIDIGAQDMVLVTLTLCAKRVVIGHEPVDGLEVEHRHVPHVTTRPAGEQAGRHAERYDEYRTKLADRGLIPESARPAAAEVG